MKKLILTAIAVSLFWQPVRLRSKSGYRQAADCARFGSAGNRNGAGIGSSSATAVWCRRRQALQNYVETIGRKLTNVSHRPGLEWHFVVVDSPVVNAFAIPGGYVYVTRGILAYLANEAELAGVMGHEIGHVTARHSVRQITREEFAQIGLGVGGTLSPVLGQLGNMAQSGLGLVFLGSAGMTNGKRIGLASSMPHARLTIRGRSAISLRFSDGFRQPAIGKLFRAGLSTHPDPPERVQTTRTEAEHWIEMLGLSEDRMMMNREEFLRSLDGMVFGNESARWVFRRRTVLSSGPPLSDRVSRWMADRQHARGRDRNRTATEGASAIDHRQRSERHDNERVHPLSCSARAKAGSTRQLRIHGYEAVVASYPGESPVS